jgi:hypothetical protein
VPGKGHLTFVYACDPEDNVIEIQAWSVTTTDEPRGQ